MLLTPEAGIAMPEIDSRAGRGLALMPATPENSLLGSLPVRLPSYEVVVREYDRSVLISLEYIPELWVGRRGRGRLDFCFDVAGHSHYNVQPGPPPGADSSAPLRTILSNFLDRMAYFTRPGVSLGYAFKP